MYKLKGVAAVEWLGSHATPDPSSYDLYELDYIDWSHVHASRAYVLFIWHDMIIDCMTTWSHRILYSSINLLN